MIINYPTGLFSTVIPQKPSVVGNVTYTISNNIPPDSNIELIVLPKAERLKRRSSLSHDLQSRRASFGELIFTVNNSINKIGGSNRKLFELGEFIELGFEDVVLSDDNTPSEFAIQHNVNVLDLINLGLSESHIANITKASFDRKNNLEEELSKIKLEIEILKSEISENQKKLNEINKAIKSVTILIDVIGEEPLNVLIKSKENTEQTKYNLSIEYNNKISESEKIFEELLIVSNMVK